MKILIIGSMRSVKDTLAEIINKNFGISFLSSSEAANDIFIFNQLKEEYGYKNEKECFGFSYGFFSCNVFKLCYNVFRHKR